MSSRHLEVRCTCPHAPLLATAGRTPEGEGYVHVRAYKGSRLIAEVIVTSGTARMKCRECHRWMCVQIVREKYRPEVSTSPPSGEILEILEAAPGTR